MNSIRVMSFNIRYDNANDMGNSWRYRKDMAASIFRFHKIDIGGLQEVLINQLKDLLGELPGYDFIGVGREDGEEEGEFSPIIYKKDSFIPMTQGTFWLSQTPDVKGSIGWDAACRRIVTWAEFKDTRTQKAVFYFNTHFDHAGETAKKESAHLLLKRIEEIAGENAVVVTGDFNSTENSLAYRILTGNGSSSKTGNLTDSRHCTAYAHHGPTITFHAFRGNEYIQDRLKETKMPYQWHGEEMFSLIDFIFIKNKIKVLQEGVLADNWDGRYPSDHMPVIADIDLF